MASSGFYAGFVRRYVPNTVGFVGYTAVIVTGIALIVSTAYFRRSTVRRPTRLRLSPESLIIAGENKYRQISMDWNNPNFRIRIIDRRNFSVVREGKSKVEFVMQYDLGAWYISSLPLSMAAFEGILSAARSHSLVERRFPMFGGEIVTIRAKGLHGTGPWS